MTPLSLVPHYALPFPEVGKRKGLNLAAPPLKSDTVFSLKDCVHFAKGSQEVPVVGTGPRHKPSSVLVKEADNCFLLQQCSQFPFQVRVMGHWAVTYGHCTVHGFILLVAADALLALRNY